MLSAPTFLLRSQPVLFIECAATELWYVSLYLLKFEEGPAVLGIPAVRLLFYVCSPLCLFKQVANVVQMYIACDALVQHDCSSAKK